MHTKSSAVLEAPADAQSAAGGAAAAYGGFWIRFLAYFADTAIVVLGLLVLMVPAAFMGAAGAYVFALLCWAGPILYFALMHASARQATFGKELLGLKVAHAGNGARISFLRSLGRELAKFISALPLGIGFVIAGFTARKQGLHDLIAGTVVVRERSARVFAAVAVIVAGILIPAVAVPLMLGAFMGGMVMAMMGGMMSAMMGGATTGEPGKPVPAISQPAVSQPAAQPPAGAKPAAAAKAPRQPSPMTEADYDKLLAAPFAGAAKPSSARAGPALLHLDTFWSDSFWLKVQVPSIPNLERGRAIVEVNRVVDTKGQDRYDPNHTFEKPTFRQVKFSSQAEGAFSGTRDVHVSKGTTENDVRQLEGVLHLSLPVGLSVVSLAQEDAGKERAAGSMKVTLKAIEGQKVTLNYAGPEENVLGATGYDAGGAAVQPESWSYGGGSYTYAFKTPVAKVDLALAEGFVKREFPFTLVRGQTAPAASESAAAQAKAPAPAPAPAQAAAAPAPAPTPAAEKKPAPAPVAIAKSVAAEPPAPPRASTPAAAKKSAPPEPAPVAATPAPPKRVAAVKPETKSAPIAAPSLEQKAAAPRPVAMRKAAPRAALPEAPAPAAPTVKTSRYNDVMTPVMLGDHAGVAEALAVGSWADQRDSNGITPLMAAALRGEAGIASLLLEHGADPNYSARGGSVLDYARKGGDGKTIDVLKRAGAR